MSDLAGTDAARPQSKHLALIALVLAVACAIGAVVTLGGSGGAMPFVAGAAVAGIIGAAAVALDLPLLAVARFAFIASFFFKADLSFYKINEVEDPSGFNLSLTLVTAVALIVHDIFGARRARVFPPLVSLIVASLTIAAVFSVVYAGSTLLGWFSVWSFLTSVAVAYAVASHFSERERLLELVYGIGIGLLVTGLVAASQYAIEFPTNLDVLGTGTEDELAGTQSEALSRVPAFLRTPTEMAWVVSSLIPLALAPLVARERSLTFGRKTLIAAGLGAGVIAVVLSLARGSWIGLIIAVPVVFLLGWMRLDRRELRDHALIVIGAGLLTGVLLIPVSSRIVERLSGDDDGSAMIRVPLMETAVRIIGDNPLVGVGLNGYRDNMGRYDETEMFVTRVFPNPVHNVFAHVTAEIGIPGGIAFALLILVAFAEALRAMASRDRLVFAVALGTAAGLAAFVVSAIKEPGSLGSARPGIRTLFLLIGVALAVGRIRRRMLF